MFKNTFYDPKLIKTHQKSVKSEKKEVRDFLVIAKLKKEDRI